MRIWAKIGLGAGAVLGGGFALSYAAYRNAMAEALQTYELVRAPIEEPTRRFDPQQIAHLPEIAQRYLRHAIAPGTPLYSVVELEMQGTFLLGDKNNFQSYDMAARQVLRPPGQFVWVPRLRSNLVTITGSDGLVEGEAWTRFWLMGLVPVANVASSGDVIRSAQFRAAVEGALWLPTTLLPENGARWEQLGPDEARVSLGKVHSAVVLHLTLDRNGAVREVVGERWSNANPEQIFRLQPFGGTITEESSFQGLTIPTAVSVGNHYGTEEYLPFFQARISRARYR